MHDIAGERVQHDEGTLRGAGGLQLLYQRWRPSHESRGVLAIVHGFGEHSGRYYNVVRALLPHHIAIYGFDLRGHGRSPGQRGHIQRWAEYREDLDTFLATVAEHEPGRPVFLMGHSMGALLALDYVLHSPEGLKGAIISGAPIQPIGVAKPYLVAIARVMSHLWPSFPVNLGLETAALSRDPTVVQAYQADPLVHGTASARWGTESLTTVDWIKAHAADIRLPLLMIHGEADRLNSVEGTRWFLDHVVFPDRELIVVPGGFHEFHNDLDNERTLAQVADWIHRHL